MLRLILPLLCLLPLCSAACDGTDDAPGIGSDDVKACANGKAEVSDFGGHAEHAAIVEIANKESLESLSFVLDKDGLTGLTAARLRGPLNSLEEVACVPGIGVKALREMKYSSLGACGGLNVDRPVASRATPRMCGLWAIPCGNDPFSPTHPVQRACLSPSPEGTFVREVATNDAFSMLPREVRFEGKTYKATYPDGRTTEGRAQQRDRARSSGGVFSYMDLYDSEDVARSSIFQLRLADDGATLHLDPLMGPIGRDVRTPAFKRRER